MLVEKVVPECQIQSTAHRSHQPLHTLSFGHELHAFFTWRGSLEEPASHRTAQLKASWLPLASLLPQGHVSTSITWLDPVLRAASGLAQGSPAAALPSLQSVTATWLLIEWASSSTYKKPFYTGTSCLHIITGQGGDSLRMSNTCALNLFPC